MNRRSKSRADGIDRVPVKVGQSVETFCSRPLVFVAQSSCDSQAVSGAPLILDVEANGMEAQGGIHRDN